MKDSRSRINEMMTTSMTIRGSSKEEEHYGHYSDTELYLE